MMFIRKSKVKKVLDKEISKELYEYKEYCGLATDAIEARNKELYEKLFIEKQKHFERMFALDKIVHELKLY